MSAGVYSRKGAVAAGERAPGASRHHSNRIRVLEPNSAFENEAHGVSDEVLGLRKPQRQWSVSGKAGYPSGNLPKGNDETNVSPASVERVVKGPGEPLDTKTRASMEPRFGYDFSHVRIHADNQAADSAFSAGAGAYTFGNHIVFGSEFYRPKTRGGQAILAHELAHVIQQNANGQPGGLGANCLTGEMSISLLTLAEARRALWGNVPDSVKNLVRPLAQQVAQRMDALIPPNTELPKPIAAVVEHPIEALKNAAASSMSEIKTAVHSGTEALAATQKKAKARLIQVKQQVKKEIRVKAEEKLGEAKGVAETAAGIIDDLIAIPVIVSELATPAKGSSGPGLQTNEPASDSSVSATVSGGFDRVKGKLDKFFDDVPEEEIMGFTTYEQSELRGMIASQVALAFVGVEEVELALKTAGALGSLRQIVETIRRNPKGWNKDPQFWVGALNVPLSILGFHKGSSITTKIIKMVLASSSSFLQLSAAISQLYNDYNAPESDRSGGNRQERLKNDFKNFILAATHIVVEIINHKGGIKSPSGSPSESVPKSRTTPELETPSSTAPSETPREATHGETSASTSPENAQAATKADINRPAQPVPDPGSMHPSSSAKGVPPSVVPLEKASPAVTDREAAAAGVEERPAISPAKRENSETKPSTSAVPEQTAAPKASKEVPKTSEPSKENVPSDQKAASGPGAAEKPAALVRVVRLDNNVIDQIGRGNAEVANTLRQLAKDPTVRVEMSRGVYIETTRVTGDMLAAREALIKGLNIKIVDETMAERLPTYEKYASSPDFPTHGQGKVTGGERETLEDLPHIASAAAGGNNVELWSFDGTESDPSKGVQGKGVLRNAPILGVTLAPECKLPKKNSPDDYRNILKLVPEADSGPKESGGSSKGVLVTPSSTGGIPEITPIKPGVIRRRSPGGKPAQSPKTEANAVGTEQAEQDSMAKQAVKEIQEFSQGPDEAQAERTARADDLRSRPDLSRTGSHTDSEILRANWEQANARPFPKGHDAHHIVPSEGGNFGEEEDYGDRARAILERDGINKNDGVNCAPLPSPVKKTNPDAPSQTIYEASTSHGEVHTKRYFKDLAEALEASPEGGAAEVLEKFADELKNKKY